MTTRQNKSLTRWHRLLAKMLEELLTPVNITVISDFKIMSSPPEADILLIRRKHLNWTEAQRMHLPDGIRDTQADHILIEFKYTESVNKNVLAQAAGYDFFYKSVQQKLKPERIQTFVLSSHTPSQLTREKFGYTTMFKPGVFHSSHPLLDDIHLIVINELSNVPHNDFIKCFASRRQVFRPSFKKLLITRQGWLSAGLYYLVTGLLHLILQKHKGEFIMNQEFTPELVMDMGKELHEAFLMGLRPEDFLARFEPDEILSRFEPDEILSRFEHEERIAGLRPEERIAGLKAEEIVNVLSPEDIEKLKKYLSKRTGNV